MQDIQMMVSLNYAITLLAYGCAVVLYRQGEKYHNAVFFMCFFGSAALMGGLVHHLQIHGMERAETLVANSNQSLPGFISPLNLEQIIGRMWFVTMVFIGFAEYYFVYLFVQPLVTGRLQWFIYYLKLMLALFCLGMVIFNEYFLVVAFHLVTHVIIMGFALVMYRKYTSVAFIYLLLLVIFNLIAGLLQQLMANKLIPTGPLHYNDWYHILIIVFVVFLQWLLTRGRLIETLELCQPKK